MNVLVTGANGQLGRCIKDRVNEIETRHNYFYTDVIGEAGDGTEYLDLIDEEGVTKYIREHSINVIINCAAYTNVDKAENDYEMAEAVNAIAPKYLANAAKMVGAKLIHISTDFVFNGMGFMPYNETRATLPINVYGATKEMGEKNIVESGCKYLIFRTAWLYSEYGNNFVKTMMRLFNEKEEVNVVNDQIGTPTYAGGLANLIVNIIEADKPIPGKDIIPLLENGIYHYTDEGVASWYDFACAVHFALPAPLSIRINGVTTKEYNSPTKRPYYTVLDKTKVKTDFKGLFNPTHWSSNVYYVVNKLIDNK